MEEWDSSTIVNCSTGRAVWSACPASTSPMGSTSSAPRWSAQPQAEATAAGAAPAVVLKDVCTDLEDAGGLGTRSGLKVHLQELEPLRVIGSQRKQQLDEQRDVRSAPASSFRCNCRQCSACHLSVVAQYDRPLVDRHPPKPSERATGTLEQLMLQFSLTTHRLMRSGCQWTDSWCHHIHQCRRHAGRCSGITH